MEKSQFDLCLRVLKKLHHAGVLDDVIVIGSWALYFYKFYFKGNEYVPDIRTRDIDFLVPLPPRLKHKADIPEMLKELGFIINFRGEGGYIRLDHPELIVILRLMHCTSLLYLAGENQKTRPIKTDCRPPIIFFRFRKHFTDHYLE